MFAISAVVVIVVVVALESAIMVVVSFMTAAVSAASSEQPCRKRAKTAIRAAKATARKDFMLLQHGRAQEGIAGRDQNLLRTKQPQQESNPSAVTGKLVHPEMSSPISRERTATYFSHPQQ